MNILISKKHIRATSVRKHANRTYVLSYEFGKMSLSRSKVLATTLYFPALKPKLQRMPDFNRCSGRAKPVVRAQSGDGFEFIEPRCKVKIIGVGGGGNNAITVMLAAGIREAELWVANTDAQVLEKHPAPNKLQLGSSLTRGLGAGGSPDSGKKAAEESAQSIRQMLQGADMAIITTGLGGGTGTGAAPVIAAIAREMGILSVAFATNPFNFEGLRRASQAVQGAEELRKAADSTIIIPNERLLQLASPSTSLSDAFALADQVLLQGVQGICGIILQEGLVNVDFADLKAVMSNSGTAMLGIGTAAGPERAERAAESALTNPLIQQSIERATGIMYNITGGSDMTLAEVNKVSEVVTRMAHRSCNIIFGAVVDPAAQGTVHVTVVATGFAPTYEERTFDFESAAVPPQPTPDATASV